MIVVRTLVGLMDDIRFVMQNEHQQMSEIGTWPMPRFDRMIRSLSEANARHNEAMT